MSYNGSGTFSINSAGQPVITGTVISSTAFNALTADLATGLSTAITKDGQTTTTARILFAQGISSTLTTDATSTTTGSIITAGGISTQKALFVGTTSNFAGTMTAAAITTSGALTLGGTLRLPSAVTTTAQINYANQATGDWSAFANLNQSYLFTAGTDQFLFRIDAETGSYIFKTPTKTMLTLSAATGAATFGGAVGIGMTPTNVLDITQTQDNRSSVALLNSSAGTSASSRFFLSNGSAGASFQFYGTGFTTSGTAKQNGLFIGNSGAGGIVIDCQVSAPLCFAINDAEAARFDTSGNLLVNRTTSINGNAKFQVTGNDVNYTSIINDGTATNGCQLIRFASNTGGIGTVTNAANVAVAYNTTSDKNLKTLVGTRENGDLFDLVEWNEFTWNKAPQIGVQVGVFAQDIQKLIPNVVAEGRGVLGDEDYEPWQVNYTGLVPYLGAEVKSLRARVVLLEARLTALENK